MYSICAQVSTFSLSRSLIGYMFKHLIVYKGPCSQSYSFSSSHVWIGELDHKEG